MADERSPTIRRRELGALLRARRQQLGMTVEQVAQRLLCSPSKVSRIETGTRGATQRDIRDLCDIYEIVSDAERDRLMKLARDGRKAGWWQGYDLVFGTYVGLESEALRIRQFQSTVVPGLLQTSEYARSLHEVGFPTMTSDRITELVEVRLTRQQILTRDPALRLEVILDEAALRRAVGGPAVMGQQLRKIVDVSRLPNVTVQVIPFSAGAHPAMDSDFRLMDFPSGVASVVYVEGLVGWIYVERPQDIERYQGVFEYLRTAALNPRESTELIQKVLAEYADRASVV